MNMNMMGGMGMPNMGGMMPMGNMGAMMGNMGNMMQDQQQSNQPPRDPGLNAINLTDLHWVSLLQAEKDSQADCRHCSLHLMKIYASCVQAWASLSA